MDKVIAQSRHILPLITGIFSALLFVPVLLYGRWGIECARQSCHGRPDRPWLLCVQAYNVGLPAVVTRTCRDTLALAVLLTWNHFHDVIPDGHDGHVTLVTSIATKGTDDFYSGNSELYGIFYVVMEMNTTS